MQFFLRKKKKKKKKKTKTKTVTKKKKKKKSDRWRRWRRVLCLMWSLVLGFAS